VSADGNGQTVPSDAPSPLPTGIPGAASSSIGGAAITTQAPAPDQAAHRLPTAKTSPPGPPPTVSIVIPCKNSTRTIRATVEALLHQDYPALGEVILVGDIDDPTWTALMGITDPRLMVLEQGPTPGRRDPNVKRHRGICAASGEVLGLVDSDIVMDPDWLSKAVTMLQAQGSGLVAGGMRSIHDTFWGRFVDHNGLAAKTPRLPRPYQVTAENFGRRGHKPPITANAVFTRDMYEQCALDERWAFGYEDYEWFWRLAKAQHAILFSNDLTAAHHHRRSFRGLAREYRQAADGCAHYMRVHPDSPLARKRLRQLSLLPTVAMVGLAGLAVAFLSGYSVAATVLLVVAAVLVTAWEVIRVRSAEAVAYPVIELALGLVFTGSMLNSWIRLALNGTDTKTFATRWPRKEAASERP
jgi:succinoglycan biosynthesis protein ExoA